MFGGTILPSKEEQRLRGHLRVRPVVTIDPARPVRAGEAVRVHPSMRSFCSLAGNGGIVLIFGFVILALGIDRVRAKIDGLNNEVDELSRRIDSLTLAVANISDTQLERKKPAIEAGDAEANLEEIRKRLEALSAKSDRNTGVDN